jgi:FkbM family methyltransferase
MDVIGGLITRVGRVSPTLGTQCLYLRQRQRADRSFDLLDRYVRKGDVVVDIGANAGLYTHRLAQLVGDAGHVHTFEPEPSNLHLLRAACGWRTNVTIHPVALSDRRGEAELHVPVLGESPVTAMASLVASEVRTQTTHATVKVQLECLDAIFGADGPVIPFIKCDVEGHELAVLRGAEQTLRRCLPAILIEIEQRHQIGDIRETFAFLSGLGYRGHFLRDRDLRPLAEFDLERDQRTPLAAVGTTDVPPASYVHDFLFVPRGR